MKASKQGTYTIALLIVILAAAYFSFNPSDARGYIPSVITQNYALILNAAPHQNLEVYSRNDLYIATDTESAEDRKDEDVKDNDNEDKEDDSDNKDEDNNDDEEDDDDWEAC